MKRCAIYTRKSTDEGLEQAFNSLDAQRGACEAFAISQVGEGWVALAEQYDDGGYSGANISRPALQRLLTDVKMGRIDIIIVYKIDRLTRCLADFARIVEQFDEAGVMFVSVTQPFSTTSSMGRLTLNVLLSFAQFEREVTGERIRDKIAASKAKGLWMGGNTPLGYDLPTAGSRELKVNSAEAETVRHIFARYLALASVHRLIEELEEDGIRSKRRVTSKGRHTGGKQFSRGAMFHLLQNRVYVGEIVHKGSYHEGRHQGIIEPSQFEQVQELLKRRRSRTNGRKTSFGFAGKLFDRNGSALTQTYSVNPRGRTYRYYVPQHFQRGERLVAGSTRFPADLVDSVINAALRRTCGETDRALKQIARIELAQNELKLTLPSRYLPWVRAHLRLSESVDHHESSEDVFTWTLSVSLRPRAGPGRVRSLQSGACCKDAALIDALRAAHHHLSYDKDGRAEISAIPKSRYEARRLRMAFLSPRIQREILDGRQPSHLRLEDLARAPIPLSWKAQEELIYRSTA